jgi:hypothetical protein
MKSINVQRLGTCLHSWDDLLSDHSAFAPKLAEAFASRLASRQIPNIKQENGEITMGSIGAVKRSYLFVTHKEGAYMTIAIRDYGKDLLLSWNLWWTPKWNILLVIICALLAPAWGIGIGIAFLAAVAGVIMKGRASAFFRSDLDFFTQEDVRAMAMAVDLSLREAADSISLGVQLSQRPDFNNAKRNRLI